MRGCAERAPESRGRVVEVRVGEFHAAQAEADG